MPGHGQLRGSGIGLGNDEESFIKTPDIELVSSIHASAPLLPPGLASIHHSDDEIGETGFVTSSQSVSGSYGWVFSMCIRRRLAYLSTLPNFNRVKRLMMRIGICRSRFVVSVMWLLSILCAWVVVSHIIENWAKSIPKLEDIKSKIGKAEDWRQWPLLNSYFGPMERLVWRWDINPEYPPTIRGNDVSEEPVFGFAKPESGVLEPYFRVSDWYRRGYVECDYNDYQYHDDGELEQEHSGEVLLRTRRRPEVRYLSGVPRRHPEPIFGNHEEVGLNDSERCFDRYGRLGAYGFGYGVEEGGLGVGLGTNKTDDGEGGEGPGTMPMQKIDWRGIDWGQVQQRCVKRNQKRFAPVKDKAGYTGSPMGGANRDHWHKEKRPRKSRDDVSRKPDEPMERTAFLLRSWDDYKYTWNDIVNLRSIISELAINTGGEYTIHLLVHVKDGSIPIWTDKQTYDSHLKNSVPREFWGITTLWNEPLMALVYSALPSNEFRGLPIHGVYRSSFMPVQWFALNHPEYEYFWNWEMDVRYLGHLWEFLHNIGEWATKQPRMCLWERNERFWIPSLHGTYQNFSDMVKKHVFDSCKSTFGPVQVPGVVALSTDTKVPDAVSNDPNQAQKWGEYEPADLITFSPLFNPNNTHWLLSEDTTGYTKQPPRRAAIIATSRLSRRLLITMHAENAHHKHAAFTEMWPATCALHHGLKAVYVPHPVYIDRKWPLWYVDRTFNHGPMGASGGAPESVFGSQREHNFRGTSWYYNAEFSGELYKRWALGKAKDGKGRMCSKAMLLHPIKNVPDSL